MYITCILHVCHSYIIYVYYKYLPLLVQLYSQNNDNICDLVFHKSDLYSKVPHFLHNNSLVIPNDTWYILWVCRYGQGGREGKGERERERFTL